MTTNQIKNIMDVKKLYISKLEEKKVTHEEYDYDTFLYDYQSEIALILDDPLNYYGNLYYICCFRHQNKKDFTMEWWGVANKGYTPNLDHAGMYNYDQIKSHIGHECSDMPIKCSEIDKIAVELEYNYNSWELGRFVINNELFWNSYNINPKWMNTMKGYNGNARYFRYPINKQ